MRVRIAGRVGAVTAGEGRATFGVSAVAVTGLNDCGDGAAGAI